MAVRAVHRNFGMSPKKVRRVLGLIRGQPVAKALAALQFMPSPAASAVRKAVQSAVANAENNHMMSAEELRVIAAYANDGPRLKRFRPQARGRVSRIIRRSCHISILVEETTEDGS